MVSEAQLLELERYAGAPLPQDYRRFLTTCGAMREGFGEKETFLELYSAGEVRAVNDAAETQRRFPGGLVIGGDGSREMLTYDFRDGAARLVLLDITAADWSDAIFQAPSLTKLLENIGTRGWLFE